MKIEVAIGLAPQDRAVIEQGARTVLPGTDVAENVPLCVTLRDHYQTLIGGALGNTGAAWCYVSSLWVAENARRLGWGTQLLGEVEAEAKRRGCRHVYLDTFSAAEFYRKCGYTVFATLEDFPGERQRVFLRKDFYP